MTPFTPSVLLAAARLRVFRPSNRHDSHDLPGAPPILVTLNPCPRPIQFPISITQTRRKISAAFWPPNPRLSLMTVFTRALRFTFGT